MESFRYFLYLQKCNGWWEKEPYFTLEEVQNTIDTLDENEYWWYIIKDSVLEKTDGYGIIGGGKVHTKEENKTRRKKKGR